MSEEAARKSHTMAWILSIVTVLVLYPLSVGPLIYCQAKGWMASPSWVRVVYAPLNFLSMQCPPLMEIMGEYSAWWNRLAGRKPMSISR